MILQNADVHSHNGYRVHVWRDDTTECRRALAQWVQSTCIMSGFEVACLSLQKVPLNFVCKETQNV
jgi:hypothetical protein